MMPKYAKFSANSVLWFTPSVQKENYYNPVKLTFGISVNSTNDKEMGTNDVLFLCLNDSYASFKWLKNTYKNLIENGWKSSQWQKIPQKARRTIAQDHFKIKDKSGSLMQNR